MFVLIANISSKARHMIIMFEHFHHVITVIASKPWLTNQTNYIAVGPLDGESENKEPIKNYIIPNKDLKLQQ